MIEPNQDTLKLLRGSYSYQAVPWDEFLPFFQENRSRLFPSQFDINPEEHYSDQEKAALEKLGEKMFSLYRLCYVVFKESEVVGWAFGIQESREKFYLINGGFFEEHRGRGLFKAFMDMIIDDVKSAGFQIIEVHHKATNNDVIIPMLRLGFVVTGLEMNDRFGHASKAFIFL